MEWQEFQSKIKSYLIKVENQIMQLEKLYFEDTIPFGNIFKGWEFYASLKKNQETVLQKKNFKITNKNRLFSLSAVSSSISKQTMREDKQIEGGLLAIKNESKDIKKKIDISDESFNVDKISQKIKKKKY